MKKIVCILLVMCTLFSTLAVTASAETTSAFSALSSSKPAKVYSISTGNTIPYTTSALSTRGTVTYGASRYSYIAASDEIYVYSVGKNNSGTYWAYVSYPTSSRRVYAFIPLSAISPSNSTHAKTTASARFNVSIRPGGAVSSSYYVDKGDPVWLLAVSGNNYQIMYPSGSSAYRIAWVTKSTYNSYCAPKLSVSTGSLSFTRIGQKQTVTAKVTGTQSPVLWSSSNTKVATVSYGEVTAQGNGTCTIIAICGDTSATVNVTVSIATTPTPMPTRQIVSDDEIARAASQHGISPNSNAFHALQSINTKYYSKLSGSKDGNLVFFFEGVGSDNSATARMNAMCVVVKAGKIVFLDLNSSTIPDYPFNPSRNGGTPMPTVKSGIYSFRSLDHLGKYAGLTLKSVDVIRHKSATSYYASTSEGIDVHRRSTDAIAPASASWVNSAGCLIVGKTPNSTSSSSYARFLQSLGVVGLSGTAYSHVQNSNVSGYVIVDRTYAQAYLKAIGYSDGAIKALG